MLLISEKLCGRKAYMGMFTKILYGAAILGLMISFVKDREKTKLVLKKAWRSLENILPSILAILLLIGFILTFLDAQAISKLLGTDSGAFGMVIAAVVGCVTLIPGFVAFPLAASPRGTSPPAARAAGRNDLHALSALEKQGVNPANSGGTCPFCRLCFFSFCAMIFQL